MAGSCGPLPEPVTRLAIRCNSTVHPHQYSAPGWIESTDRQRCTRQTRARGLSRPHCNSCDDRDGIARQRVPHDGLVSGHEGALEQKAMSGRATCMRSRLANARERPLGHRSGETSTLNRPWFTALHPRPGFAAWAAVQTFRDRAPHIPVHAHAVFDGIVEFATRNALRLRDRIMQDPAWPYAAGPAGFSRKYPGTASEELLPRGPGASSDRFGYARSGNWRGISWPRRGSAAATI